MGTKVDLKGQRFGRLTAIREDESRRNGAVMWLCRCDCGNEVLVRSSHLRRGGVVSCGCYNRDVITTHGETHTRLYRIWDCMRNRCLDANNLQYKDYGGRGIKVCDEWSDFEAFKKWAITEGYQNEAKRGKCTLDRIDNYGDYEPNNCRWVDMKAQGRNRRSNVYITWEGEKHCLSEWAEILKAPYARLVSRHRRGWSDKEILFGRA